jgi:hypothetical protein
MLTKYVGKYGDMLHNVLRAKFLTICQRAADYFDWKNAMYQKEYLNFRKKGKESRLES